MVIRKSRANTAVCAATKQKSVGKVIKVRNAFLRLVQNFTITSVVILVVYLTATVLIPTIGGVLAESIGLSGQVHYYNMLQSWGFPMLCITGSLVVGNVMLCKHLIKRIKAFFEARMVEDSSTLNNRLNK